MWVNGATVLWGMQDDIYKEWPLGTLPPPPRNQVQRLGSGPEMYTFHVDGLPPVEVRPFTVKGLVAARQNNFLRGGTFSADRFEPATVQFLPLC